MNTNGLSQRARVVFLMMTILLFVSGTALLSGSGAHFGRREAFAARVQRNAPAFDPRRIATEWRSEIAAQARTARRNRILGGLLVAAGLVSVVTLLSGGTTPPLPTTRRSGLGAA